MRFPVEVEMTNSDGAIVAEMTVNWYVRRNDARASAEPSRCSSESTFSRMDVRRVRLCCAPSLWQLSGCPARAQRTQIGDVLLEHRRGALGVEHGRGRARRARRPRQAVAGAPASPGTHRSSRPRRAPVSRQARDSRPATSTPAQLDPHDHAVGGVALGRMERQLVRDRSRSSQERRAPARAERERRSARARSTARQTRAAHAVAAPGVERMRSRARDGTAERGLGKGQARKQVIPVGVGRPAGRLARESAACSSRAGRTSSSSGRIGRVDHERLGGPGTGHLPRCGP